MSFSKNVIFTLFLCMSTSVTLVEIKAAQGDAALKQRVAAMKDKATFCSNQPGDIFKTRQAQRLLTSCEYVCGFDYDIVSKISQGQRTFEQFEAIEERCERSHSNVRKSIDFKRSGTLDVLNVPPMASNPPAPLIPKIFTLKNNDPDLELTINKAYQKCLTNVKDNHSKEECSCIAEASVNMINKTGSFPRTQGPMQLLRKAYADCVI